MPREPELYKDKIEVSLGAVIVGMVFVLGVMVGRRVEARGHVDVVRTKAANDPLAALDQLTPEGGHPTGGFAFPKTLTGTPAAPTEVEHKIAEIEKVKKAEPAAKKADKKDKKADKADKQPEKLPEKQPEKIEKQAPVAAANPDLITHDDDKKPEKADKPAKAKFTLQLSSFQDRGEADAFVASVKAAGYQPYVTEAEVNGKGTFYRVRVGNYRSMEAANDAKVDVEKALKKTASVMRL